MNVRHVSEHSPKARKPSNLEPPGPDASTPLGREGRSKRRNLNPMMTSGRLSSRTAAGLLGMACLLSFNTATAVPQVPEISGFTADPSGPPNQDPTEVYVLGDVRFFGEEPVTVGTDPQFDHSLGAAGLFGMDIKSLAIWQPDITAGTLWFAMSLWDFQAIAPEATSWRWTFNVDGVPWQLEAARGGLALDSTSSSLAAWFSQPGLDTFRLLGPCNAAGTSCPFVRHVEGQIDINSDRVIWRAPTEGPLSVGRTITPHPAGAIAQIGAAGNHYIDRALQNALKPNYAIAGQRVEVWVQAPNGDRVTDVYDAFLPPPDESGQLFWANLSVAHLNRGSIGPNTAFDVVARACGGNLCSTPNCISTPKSACTRVML